MARWIRSVARSVLYGLAALGTLVVVVTCTPLVNWWAYQLARPWQEPRGEVLIVLGGSAVGGGMIGESSYWRSVYAVRAWRQGGFRKVILSGEDHITAPMRQFMVNEGVPDSAFSLESQSHSTRENALFTKTLESEIQGHAVLLTSDYHMYRAYRAFRKAGLNVIASPFPDALKRAQRWWLRWPVFTELVLETGKIAYYFALGWI